MENEKLEEILKKYSSKYFDLNDDAIIIRELIEYIKELREVEDDYYKLSKRFL